MTRLIRLRAAPMVRGVRRSALRLGLLASALALVAAFLSDAAGLPEGLVALAAIAGALTPAILFGGEPPPDAAVP